MKKLFVLMLLLYLSGCTNDQDALQSNDQLLQKLRVVLNPVRTMKQGYKIIDFDSLAPFAWDSLYFFNGEEDAKHISSIIGFSWTGPEVPNAYKRLLFVHQRRVVEFVDVNMVGPIDTANKKWPLPIFMYPRVSIGKAPRSVYFRKNTKFIAFRCCSEGVSPFISIVPIDNLARFQDDIKRGCP